MIGIKILRSLSVALFILLVCAIVTAQPSRSGEKTNTFETPDTQVREEQLAQDFFTLFQTENTQPQTETPPAADVAAPSATAPANSAATSDPATQQNAPASKATAPSDQSAPTQPNVAPANAAPTT